MTAPLLIKLKYCLTPTTRINNASILLRDGAIVAVGGHSAFNDTGQFQVIEMPDCYALPGFVDTRIYGGGGYDCMHANTDRNIAGMSRMLAMHGVTSFLPTTQSYEATRLREVVAALAAQIHGPMPGAVPVGIHLEGPYLSPKKRGAHLPQHIRNIDLAEAESLLAAGAGQVRIWTFAPELDLAEKLIALLRQHGVIACLGHTMATEAAVQAAFDAGATRCSHLYNGMEPMIHRHVGLSAMSLIDDRVWVEVILDGVHIHRKMVDLACRCKPKHLLMAVSNAMEAAGLESGVFKIGEAIVHAKEGKAALEDGTIAGSVQLLDSSYRYLRDLTHLTMNQAAACVSLNPARSIGLTDRGEIRPGKRADLVIMGSQDQVLMTLVGGKIVYRAPTSEQVIERAPTAVATSA